jgi:hypothetical protein
MFDADTNRDGKLDSSDIKSLYLSDCDLQKCQWIFRS